MSLEPVARMKAVAIALVLAGCIKAPSSSLVSDFGGASSSRPCEETPCGGTLDSNNVLAFGIAGAVGIGIAVGVAFLMRH